MKPIFFGITRSFWFTMSGLALLFGAGEPVLSGFAVALAPLTGWDPVTVTAWAGQVTPAVLWLAALRERGATGLQARPYTVDPRAIR